MITPFLESLFDTLESISEHHFKCDKCGNFLHKDKARRYIIETLLEKNMYFITIECPECKTKKPFGTHPIIVQENES